MRKLLRHSASKCWVAANGQLTQNLADAVEIQDVSHALRLCREHSLKGMEIVLKFDADHYDVTLPFGDVC